MNILDNSDSKHFHRITDWLNNPVETDDVWESAYIRFETPEQEIRKFCKRLQRLGAASWNKNAKIVEIFCGRGSGLNALERLGFTSLEGVDLSRSLLEKYKGYARLYTGDCREMRFEDNSKDIIIVHGGLHHLPDLPDDLEQVIREVHRILKTHGRFCFVEPWMTPFLRMVHIGCGISFARKLWNRLDALAKMIELERSTYHRWLENPNMILPIIRANFTTEKQIIGFGKIIYAGIKP